MGKELTERDIQCIFDLHDRKYTNRKIAKELGINHKTVAGYLTRSGRVANGPAKTSLIFTDETLERLICTRCNEEFPRSFFQKGRVGTEKEYLFSYCNNCRRTQSTNNLRLSVEKFLNDRTNRKIRYCKENNIPCDLTKEHILYLWKVQAGLCFYTDVPLQWEANKTSIRDSISIDRVDCKGGYTIGNVVLCSNRINTMKSDATLEEMEKWMPLWYNRIMDMWRQNGYTCLQVAEGNF